jgi:hypothetical protein
MSSGYVVLCVVCPYVGTVLAYRAFVMLIVVLNMKFFLLYLFIYFFNTVNQ